MRAFAPHMTKVRRSCATIRSVAPIGVGYDTSMVDKRKTGRPGEDTGVLTRTKPETKKPSMYKVLLLIDDYTPMEFVIVVLMRIFGMGQEKATEVMLNVHRSGVGVCGVYSFEVAETKVTQVMGLAQRNEHPLQCTMEKD